MELSQTQIHQGARTRAPYTVKNIRSYFLICQNNLNTGLMYLIRMRHRH